VLEAVMFGVGRRTPGNLPTAVMRMSVGPLGQWESPTVGHRQHHSDTVGTQLKMVQQIVVFNMWFVTLFSLFSTKNQSSLIPSVYLLFKIISDNKHVQSNNLAIELTFLTRIYLVFNKISKINFSCFYVFVTSQQ
jgi:hypothetical protein